MSDKGGRIMGLQNTKSQKYEHIVHPFPPLYDDDSEILILGSLPSVNPESRCSFMDIPRTDSGRL